MFISVSCSWWSMSTWIRKTLKEIIFTVRICRFLFISDQHDLVSVFLHLESGLSQRFFWEWDGDTGSQKQVTGVWVGVCSRKKEVRLQPAMSTHTPGYTPALELKPTHGFSAWSKDGYSRVWQDWSAFSKPKEQTRVVYFSLPISLNQTFEYYYWAVECYC